MNINLRQVLGSDLPKINTIIENNNKFYIITNIFANQASDNELGESTCDILLECDRILQAYACNDSGYPEKGGLVVFVTDKYDYISKDYIKCKKELFKGIEVCPFGTDTNYSLLDFSYKINTTIIDFTLIYNGTSHEVYLFSTNDVFFDEKTRKNYLKDKITKPFLVIPAGTSNLSAKFAEKKRIGTYDLPIYNESKVTSVDEIPDGYDLYIVSQLYKNACRQIGNDTSQLITVADPVYNSDSRPVGCLGFEKGF